MSLSGSTEWRSGEFRNRLLPGLDDVSGEDSGLYVQEGQVDAAPTVAQQKAAIHASEETEEALRSWNRWKEGSLPKLNSQLAAAHLSQLNLQLRPRRCLRAATKTKQTVGQNDSRR
jgi:hypothetical protein